MTETDLFGTPDVEFLYRLMDVPSVSPLEGGEARQTARAQRLFAEGAQARGFRLLLAGPPGAEVLDGPEVPAAVRDLLGGDPGLLATQPSVVVAMGAPDAPANRRLVVNFHMDTVGPHVPPRIADGVLSGRGAVDDKGPGVAALCGVAAAFAQEPRIAEAIEVRVCSVPGEEGGAMGSFGTRWLTSLGHVGRLMLFAEPTGQTFMDLSTATMTLRVTVDGEDSTDDHPEQGHNATVALGFLATRLAGELGRFATVHGARATVAGLHTGSSHNRVYGTGQLLLNIAYPDSGTGALMHQRVTEILGAAGAAFRAGHADNPLTRRLAADWDRVVRADWLKQGLPTLANRDPAMEAVLRHAGLRRHSLEADGAPFTCDAIWAGAAGRYVAVCGPGRLDRNGAHTDREHVALADLAAYADAVRRIVLRFAETVGPRPSPATDRVLSEETT
ncbi:M20/M25/M40 family metallo-hydrolase [Streptomyces sp. NPDC006235]|uniref:M20/M25/M40 family metallo-hydrolase n=1 Tax=Streptomyces sp. NPDC006235 TaxID=3156736 RepID=UPI0033AF97C7